MTQNGWIFSIQHKFLCIISETTFWWLRPWNKTGFIILKDRTLVDRKGHILTPQMWRRVASVHFKFLFVVIPCLWSQVRTGYMLCWCGQVYTVHNNNNKPEILNIIWTRTSPPPLNIPTLSLTLAPSQSTLPSQTLQLPNQHFPPKPCSFPINTSLPYLAVSQPVQPPNFPIPDSQSPLRFPIYP